MKARLLDSRTALCLAVGATFCVASAASAQRSRQLINDGWRFHLGGGNLAEKPANPDSMWERVQLPHTWNAKDPFDDVPSYRRDIGWYRRHVVLPDSLKDKNLYLFFEGANQVADVFVNNAFVGRHRGGYTAFRLDITKWVKFGADNVIAVQVNSAHDAYIPPLSVGYALYGGIYRDVWLEATDRLHFATSNHGASGVAVSAPTLSGQRATVRTEGWLMNDAAAMRTVVLVTTLLDRAGRQVWQTRSDSLRVAAHDSSHWSNDMDDDRPVHLWSPDDPYLYTVRSELVERGRTIDRVDTPFGFRSFAFASDGFTLNGRKLQLRGTNRHQDMAGLGSALSNDLHRRDMQIIKDMGANFVRLAHYPQDPAVLAAADSLGLLIWEEVPVVNYITPAPEFVQNAQSMLTEMIEQHRNHPSVIMWGTMNEVFLWGPGGYRIGKQNDTTYMRQTRDFAEQMNRTVKRLDPARASTMAIHGSADYDSSGVAVQSDVLGLNLYNGWYNGTFPEFGTILDRRHARMPTRPIFVSEYGAEDDYRVNSLEPERFDFSNTWMRRFHESYLAQINKRPWLAGTAIWNEFDFSQPETGGSIPYMNQKGMLTWDRTPKDVYYLYKANWNPAPMVYIASRGWTRRIATDTSAQPVDVYANVPSVELFVNGRSVGAQAPDSVKRASWSVALRPGENVLVAKGGSIVDTLRISLRHVQLPLASARNFRELAINVGGKAQVADSVALWIGDRAYAAGGFGYVGGTPTMFDKDLAITHTGETPLYFTYQSGITDYRIDVPDGEYDVDLLFAEPDAKPGDRVFDVSANGKLVRARLDLAAQYGLAHAVTLTSRVRAAAGKGITVHFTPVKGQAILNAIRVRRR